MTYKMINNRKEPLNCVMCGKKRTKEMFKRFSEVCSAGCGHNHAKQVCEIMREYTKKLPVVKLHF